MPEIIGPAAARDRLRARLRELRESRGLAPAEVGQRLNWSASTIDEVESGLLPLPPLEVDALLGVYEVSGPEAERLLLLAQVAWSRPWWALHGLTDEYQDYVAYEAEATRISIYEPLVVPGPLQTPRYARAATAVILGRPEDDPVVVARVRVRAERRSRIAARPDVQFLAIVDEIVLRRVIGGPELMTEQLGHLASAAENGKVTLVVMPTSEGGHPGLGGIFELLEFGNDPSLTTVLLESTIRDQIVRGIHVHDVYRPILDSLLATGLRGADAVALVRRIQGEIGS
ncbi:helix-turn-helix domain-containing protein [Actinoplanes subtropicus]|uniref:helix-turn-helix domain-containing protein n=1 Tax=Actinoplanes subtropicus TaxID=543632 RepID=UPI00068BA920|nr:helix-turn-helix transcriptional regulator [Actinoplanes subtropicus]